MKVLLTGGTGVLSRAIATYAIERECDLTILTDGKGPLPAPEGVQEHLIADRRNPENLKQALSQAKNQEWDLVIDAVCYDGEDATSLYNLIKDRTAHTITISSYILYDRREGIPFKPSGKIAPSSELGQYGRGKLQMENVWQKAWQSSSHPVTIFRCCQILGEGCELGIVPLHNRDRLLIPRMQQGKPILLADGGRQVVQSVFADDVARVIFAAAGNPKTFGKTYNCANPQLFTARRHFEIIADLLGVTPDFESIPAEVIWNSNWGWVITTVPRLLDISSLERDVGYVPSTPVEEAIATALPFLLGKARSDDSLVLNYLREVEAQLYAAPRELAHALSVCAAKRPRAPVDVRMAEEAPDYSTWPKNIIHYST